MYLIEIGESGTFRRASADEVSGINTHREHFPKCNGSQIRDYADRTTVAMNRRLRCVDDGVWLTVPTPLF